MGNSWTNEQIEALIEFHAKFGPGAEVIVKQVGHGGEWPDELDDYDVTEVGFEETVRIAARCFVQAAEIARDSTDWAQRLDVEKLKLRVTCPDTGVSKLFGFRLEAVLVELD